MKQRFIGYSCVVVLLSVVFAGRLLAASTPGTRSLTGLKSVRIVVEDLNRDMQALGLHKEQLHALAAQQLSKDGFTVIGPQDPTKVPIVYVRLSSVIGGAGKDAPASFYLTVQVKQLAMLTQGAASTCQAAAAPETPSFLVTTWERGNMAMVDRTELLFYTQRILINLLGELATDQKEASGLAQGE